MNCNNCGTTNIPESKFCVKCGSPLTTNGMNNGQTLTSEQQVSTQTMQMDQSFVQVSQSVEQTQSVQPAVATTYSSTNTVGNMSLNYLMYIIAILLRPFKCYKEEEAKLANTKTALILSTIVAGSMMIIDLFKAMISAVFVKSFDLSTLSYKTSFEISGLKNLDYLQLIGKNLLIYAGILVAIALVYYLVSLVFKKQVNFIKLLSITSTSFIPYVLVGMVIAPILSKVWADLYLILIIISVVYSLLIFINLINDEIMFEDGDMKIYFNGICIAILLIAGYYLMINLITSSISSDLGSMLNMFS